MFTLVLIARLYMTYRHVHLAYCDNHEEKDDIDKRFHSSGTTGPSHCKHKIALGKFLEE